MFNWLKNIFGKYQDVQITSKSDYKRISSLIGLAVGDAFGAPYEFKRPPLEVADEYIEGGVHMMDRGEWSDDTSMALCLAQSLIECKGFDAHNQMKKYLMWYEMGHLSTREKCFDIGNTIARALSMYKYTKEPYCGITGDSNSGNGSLMRLAPIAMFYYKSEDKLIECAANSSKTTHASEICIDACIYFAKLLSATYQDVGKEELLSKDFMDTSMLRIEIQNIANGSYKEDKKFKPTGYVVDSLECAMMAFYRYDNFFDGLKHLVSLGYDTDTAGAIYGQIAGAYYGYESIPNHLIDNLVQKEMIFEIAKELCSWGNSYYNI